MAKRQKLNEKLLMAWNTLSNRAVFQQNRLVVNAVGECGVKDEETGGYRKIGWTYATTNYGMPEKEVRGKINTIRNQFSWLDNDISGYKINKKRRHLIGRINYMPYIIWVNMPVPVSNLSIKAEILPAPVATDLPENKNDVAKNSFSNNDLLWAMVKKRLQRVTGMIHALFHKMLNLFTR